MPFAAAQYVYNPAAADEAPGIRYFGSAKDDKGALLPGVSILLSTGQLSFLLVTDNEGRFRSNLPLDMLPGSVTPKCFKAGFQLVQMSKRLGPTGPKVTVQIDCVLRALHSQNLSSATPSDLEAFRRNGDLRSQRRHVWDVIARLTRTQPHHHRPPFESWYGEDAVFATGPTLSAARGIRGFSRANSDDKEQPGATTSADAPVLTYTLYNAAAHRHIREHRLYLQSRCVN